MTDPVQDSATGTLSLSYGQRWASAALGIVASGGGVSAIFIKNNGSGAGVLLVVGFVFLLMAVTGRAITSVKLPGGGQVDLETTRLGEKAKQIARAADPADAARLTEQLIADAGAAAKMPDPEGHAQRVAQIWVELGSFVDMIAKQLQVQGITYRYVSGQQVPRIVATVNGADYGLYVTASTLQSPQWVDWAVAAAQRLTPTVKPVLVLEEKPEKEVQLAAQKQNVLVMWREGEHLSPPPWAQDPSP
jgi:hypothetical protein